MCQSRRGESAPVTSEGIAAPRKEPASASSARTCRLFHADSSGRSRLSPVGFEPAQLKPPKLEARGWGGSRESGLKLAGFAPRRIRIPPMSQCTRGRLEVTRGGMRQDWVRIPPMSQCTRGRLEGAHLLLYFVGSGGEACRAQARPCIDSEVARRPAGASERSDCARRKRLTDCAEHFCW